MRDLADLNATQDDIVAGIHARVAAPPLKLAEQTPMVSLRSEHPVEAVTPSLVTVTIGRNVATGRQGEVGPMPRVTWDAFKNHVQGLLSILPGAQVFGPFTGQGEWEGVTEESVTFTALTTHPDLDGAQSTLGLMLSSVARNYGQDAIAWSCGPARLALS